MNKIWKKIGVLAGIFVAAAGIYFIASLNSIDELEAVYTDMEEPTLPVIYGSLPGGEANRLFAYCREMDVSAARDSLIILPEDRKLSLSIEECGQTPLSLSYEIRTMDQERLVERTEVTDWQETEEGVLAVFPIQNLIARGQQYLLHVKMMTEDHGALHYYSRILWPEENENYGETMLAFARDFSEKTLAGEGAESLVTYLETSDTADNTSLGHVTIESSFSQLTWAGLTMEPVTPMQVTLQELDGIMGQVQVSYLVKRASENGTEELYDVKDHYTLKWNEKRLYLMDFDRRTNQIFSGSRELYSGKRILLGIGNDDAIQLEKSPDKRYLAFVFNRDLWRYDQKEQEAVKVFSFRNRGDLSGRSDNDRHGVQILSVDNEGNIDFLVYGYMNRGRHEGDNGISMFRFETGGAIAERFFVSSSEPYGKLKEDVETLACMGGQDMLYLYYHDSVFAVDLLSNEYMVVANGLKKGCFSISSDQTLFAWQETQKAEGSSVIHLMDLTSGNKKELQASQGSMLRTLGFVQQDLVYGLVRPGDVWKQNGRVKEYPMYAVEIVNGELQVQTRYEKAGYYLADTQVKDARVWMERLVSVGNDSYVPKESDTIVCNTASPKDSMESIGWYASEIRRKVYFIQPDESISSSRGVRVSVAKRITYDQSETLLLESAGPEDGKVYYAYGRGEFLGSFQEFSQAVAAAYDVMGYVTDENQRMLWNRVDRLSLKNIRNPETEAYEILQYVSDPEKTAENAVEILDARGCTMNQMLYFIDKGLPVAAFTENGNYVLLSGFDSFNVTVYDPGTGETYKMGLNDGAAYFESCGNDFIAGLRLE